MLCGDRNGKEIQKRGDIYKLDLIACIYIYIHIGDSLCCTEETNTTL